MTTVPGPARHAPRARGVCRLVSVLAGVVFALLLASPAASAHAQLVDSTPADGAQLSNTPEHATLTFNETVQLPSQAIRLFHTDGSSTNLPARVAGDTVHVRLPDSIGQGGYALSWRVISADTHVVSGVVSFTIGDAEAAPPKVTTSDGSAGAAVTGANLIHYLGLLAFLGLLVFLLLVAPVQQPRPRAVRPLVATAGAAAIVGSAIAVPAAALQAAGLPLWSLGSITDWARDIEWQRLVTLGVTLATLATVTASHPHTAPSLSRAPTQQRADRAPAALPPPRRRRRAWAILGLSGLAVTSQVLVGHSMSHSPRWAIMLADAAHMVAAAVWFGGLLGLLAYLAPARGAERDARTSADMVARFSTLAGGTVALLAASGIGMSLLVFDRWSDLVLTDYGRALLVKLGLLAVVLSLAAWNRYRLVPTLTKPHSERTSWHRLCRLLSYEAALLTAILLVTAVLVTLNPTRPAEGSNQPGEPVSTDFTTTAGDYTVTGHITSRTNRTTITFRLTDHDGKSVDLQTPPTVEASLPAEHLGPLNAETTRHDGTYQARLRLPTSGDWTIEIPLRVSEFAEPIATTHLHTP